MGFEKTWKRIEPFAVVISIPGSLLTIINIAKQLGFKSQALRFLGGLVNLWVLVPIVFVVDVLSFIWLRRQLRVKTWKRSLRALETIEEPLRLLYGFKFGTDADQPRRAVSLLNDIHKEASKVKYKKFQSIRDELIGYARRADKITADMAYDDLIKLLDNRAWYLLEKIRETIRQG